MKIEYTLIRVNNFYNKVLMLKTASSDLRSRIDETDFSNQGLFDEFEELEKLYTAIKKTIKKGFSKKSIESVDELIEAIHDFDKKCEKLINSDYLSLEADNDDWVEEENFPPSKIIELLRDMAADIEETTHHFADALKEYEETRVDEVFLNNRNIEHGDTGLSYIDTDVDKETSKLRVRKYFEKIRLLRRVNPNHPEYTNYLELRKSYWERLKNDPERYAKYKNKALFRSKKYYNKIKEEAKKLNSEILNNESLSSAEIDRKKEEMLALLAKLPSAKTRKERASKEKEKDKEIGFKGTRSFKSEEATFGSLLKAISEKLTKQKFVLKTEVSDQIKNLQIEGRSKFEKELDNLKKAHLVNEDIRVKMVDLATKALNKAINDEAEKHIRIVEYISDRNKFLLFLKECGELDETKIMDKSDVPHEAVSFLKKIVSHGKTLIEEYQSKQYFVSKQRGSFGIVDYVQMVINRVEGKLKVLGEL